MSHLLRSFQRYSPVLLLAGSQASAQTVRQILTDGDPFLGFTIGEVRGIAIDDNGGWFAAVSTLPPQGTSLSVIHHTFGADGIFTPGLVPGVTGVSATLLNDAFPRAPRLDYWRSGNTITMTNVLHGLLVGEAVRLNFQTALPGSTPPADGFFSVQSVPDAFTFTILHPDSGNCGSAIAPCGKAEFVRTVQSADFDHSLTCLPAFQGVMQLEDDDDPMTAPVITPTRNDSGLFWNSTLLLREGDPSGAPEVSPGTIYTVILRSAVDARQDYLLLAKMYDPVAGSLDALVKVDVSEACPPVLLSERILVKTGDRIQNSGLRRFSSFNAQEQRSFGFNQRGDFIYLGKLVDRDGSPSVAHPVIVNNREVLREFDQVPGGAGEIMRMPRAAVDINDLGDYVIQLKVQLPTRVGEAILKGHKDTGAPTKFIESDDPLPDTSLGLSNEIMLKLGRNARVVTDTSMHFPVLITNGGDVVWYGEWGHVDPSGAEITVGSGIFCNKKVVAMEGQVFLPPDDFLLEIGTSASPGYAELPAEIEVSPNGRYLLFEGVRGKLSDLFYARNALFRVDLGESVPYGTVVQATAGTGCSHAYPGATLDCTPGIRLPGSTTLGDFPLLGHQFQAVARSAPAGTTTALFAFTPGPPVDFPCGAFRPGFPFEVLLGPTSSAKIPVAYSGSALLSIPIPASAIGLLDTDWYGQAFFKNGAGQTLGATNAIRFVIGAQ